jgi:hypothetical protein
MHRSGFSTTRSHRVRQLTNPSLQIPAKADYQKRWNPARQPAGWQAWCMTACWQQGDFSYLNNLK